MNNQHIVDNMQRYIELSKTENDLACFDISVKDLRSLLFMSKENLVDALVLAFNYGRSKGYRAAKAAAKKTQRMVRK